MSNYNSWVTTEVKCSYRQHIKIVLYAYSCTVGLMTISTI
jgi:hypothetical protein